MSVAAAARGNAERSRHGLPRTLPDSGVVDAAEHMRPAHCPVICDLRGAGAPHGAHGRRRPVGHERRSLTDDVVARDGDVVARDGDAFTAFTSKPSHHRPADQTVVSAPHHSRPRVSMTPTLLNTRSSGVWLLLASSRAMRPNVQPKPRQIECKFGIVLSEQPARGPFCFGKHCCGLRDSDTWELGTQVLQVVVGVTQRHATVVPPGLARRKPHSQLSAASYTSGGYGRLKHKARPSGGSGLGSL